MNWKENLLLRSDTIWTEAHLNAIEDILTSKQKEIEGAIVEKRKGNYSLGYNSASQDAVLIVRDILK